jgi:alpha-amylase
VVTEFQYGQDLGLAFHKSEGKTLHSLIGMGTKTGLLPSTDALVFVDNHENQRVDYAGKSKIINYKESKLYIMATAFLLAYPYGIARIMSSYEFEDIDEGKI